MFRKMKAIIIGGGSIGKRHAQNLNNLNILTRIIDIDEIHNIDNILTPVRQNFIANRIPHFRLAFKESKYGEYKEKCQFTLQNMAKGNCMFIVNRKFDTVELWLLEIYARCSKTFIVPDRKWRKANEYNMQFLHRNPYKDLHCIIKTMQKKKSKKGV